jgi:hypothetical protein
MCIKVGSQYRPEHEYLERQHVSVF